MQIPCIRCGAESTDMTDSRSWTCRYCSTIQEYIAPAKKIKKESKPKYNVNDVAEIWTREEADCEYNDR